MLLFCFARRGERQTDRLQALSPQCPLANVTRAFPHISTCTTR